MTRKLLALALSLLAMSLAKAAPFETITYNAHGADTLRLDFYKSSCEKQCPVLIYAFGGGFKGGARQSEAYDHMFNTLVANGISVASIDYRTTLKDADQAEMMTPDGFKANLMQAITTATADLLDATSYIYTHAGELGIDPAMIFACGSSAGAITVLQAEYSICNIPGIAAQFGLPQDFNYAGVVAMAGAICSEGAPVWAKTPCPLLMFHGDADAVVPYEKAELDGFGLWGSKTISEGLDSLEAPHRFHVVSGASHEINATPMTENAGEIADFIQAVAEGRCNTIVKTTDTNPKIKDYNTHFTILDYIKANL